LIEIASGGRVKDGHGAVVYRMARTATVTFPLDCTNCIGGDTMMVIDLRTLKVVTTYVGQ
jgi:hypothetical protein